MYNIFNIIFPDDPTILQIKWAQFHFFRSLKVQYKYN